MNNEEENNEVDIVSEENMFGGIVEPSEDPEEFSVADEPRENVEQKSFNRSEREAPYNLDAEKSILGAILLDNEAIHSAVLEICNEDFFKSEHGVIFDKMQKLSEAGKVIDIITLCDALSQDKILGEAGGSLYITELFNFVSSTAHISFHSEIVRQKAVLRRLISACNEITNECYSSPGEVDGLLDRAEQLILNIREKNSSDEEFQEIKDVVKDSFKEIERLYKSKSGISGIATGFTDFDKLTSGLHNSEFIVIAARPSMGKTSFVLNIAQEIAGRDKISVAIFSLETPAIQLCLRMICSEARIDAQRLRTGNLTEHDFPKLYRAASVLGDSPIYIDDSASINILTMRAKCRRLKRVNGLGLVIIDYLQLIQSVGSGGAGGSANRQQEISNISRSLKLLARELDIPVIALSQLNRSLESRTDKRPMLSDLRESGAIEQDGDLIAFIYRPEVYAKDEDISPEIEGKAEIIIGKQRNGPIGSVDLAFLKQYTKFENLAHGDDFE